MTYLWQEEKGKKYYRIQTDDGEIAKKLRKRIGVRLSGRSVNTDPLTGKGLWIFSCEFSRPDRAKEALKIITGKSGKIDSEGVIFYE